jgi:acyl-CoA thioester hydrolase
VNEATARAGGDGPGPALGQGLPVPSHTEEVQPDWVDEDGALLPAYHVVIFDHAVDLLFDTIGIGWAYRRASNFGTFAVETHTTHRLPVSAGEQVTVLSYILAIDEKRLHHWHAMFKPGEGDAVSTMEQMTVHVDLEARRTAPWPRAIIARARALMAEQRSGPPVAAIGRRITL